MMRDKLLTFMAASFTAMSLNAVAAQEFPAEKPIEMTVLFGAGSAADMTARQLAEGMSRRLGVPIPVVNRTGGGGAAGYMHVAQQRPDGYSIIWNSNSISTNHYSGTLPLDHTAFRPIARVSIELPTLAVKADAPWKTLAELVEYAKANPGKVKIGNSGTGSHTHFSASALFVNAGAQVVHVPFGQGQATTNLLGGRIEATVQLPAAFVGYVKSGDMRVLAVIGSERDPVFPDAPTAREQGYDVALDMWRGVAVPSGTPDDVVAKLESAVRETVQSPEFRDAGVKLGFSPAYLPAAEFGQLIVLDDKRLGDLMGELGLKKTQ